MSLTLDQIAYLTGHESTDAVRMALKRAGVKSAGAVFGPSVWPPKKVFSVDDVWKIFGDRILERAQNDPKVKERCWSVFRDHITLATRGQAASELFADRLS